MVGTVDWKQLHKESLSILFLESCLFYRFFFSKKKVTDYQHLTRHLAENFMYSYALVKIVPVHNFVSLIFGTFLTFFISSAELDGVYKSEG